MADQSPTPKLLLFLFGAAAAAARRGASPRLARWCSAFDEWLEHRQQKYQPGSVMLALHAWQRLLTRQAKMPWELTQPDIQQHAAWMQAQGFTSITISKELGVLANFYRWCAERRVDPHCPPAFNPAAGVPRPIARPYAGVTLLSQVELDQLQGLMQRDCSPLGRRDYAFFLMRLRFGVPLYSLQQLRWGQIEFDAGLFDASAAGANAAGASLAAPGQAWVRWRAPGRRVSLSADVWQALLAWLAASHRLEGLHPGDYIFTPLVDSLQRQPIDRPQAWASGRYLARCQILRNLQLYGQQLGIPKHHLTLRALRRTAIRLRLDAGDSLEQLQTFLDSQERPARTKSRLKLLPGLPQSSPGADQSSCAGAEPAASGGDQPARRPQPPPLPRRKVRLFQPGEGLKHGLYAYSHPAQAVLAVLDEHIQGVDEQIAGLRTLARGLLELQGQTRSPQQFARLAEAYTLAAERLASLIESEKRQPKDEQADRWVEQVLTMLDNISVEFGQGPVSQQLRAEAYGEAPGAELAAGERRLAEEVASSRLVLRNTLELAQAAAQQGETGEYIHLTDIYGSACNRLLRLLRVGQAEPGRLEAFLHELLDQALSEAQASWTLE